MASSPRKKNKPGTGVVGGEGAYDVYGDGETQAGRGALELAYDLNWWANNSDNFMVVVWTYDEPQARRSDDNLAAAMYRNGASRSVFGSPDFKSHAAYCLVANVGCGEGNGAEFYQGAIDFDPNAWIDVAFTLTNGNYTAMAGYTPRTLKDYGFNGDMNATEGAPAGTLVAGADAATVVANATAAATLNSPPVLAYVADLSASFQYNGPSKVVATINNSTANGKAPYSYSYNFNVLESNDSGEGIQYTLSKSSSGGNTDSTLTIRALCFTPGPQ